MRLTLRFEMSDGVLYDFKGVNNQLLLSIKYYAPTQGTDHAMGARGSIGAALPAIVSTLNPDYDPDFMRYMSRQTGFAPRLDDQGYDPYDEDDEEDDAFGYDERDDERDDEDDYDGAQQRPIASEADMRRFDAETQRAVQRLQAGTYEHRR
jgi:hypothetical protein